MIPFSSEALSVIPLRVPGTLIALPFFGPQSITPRVIVVNAGGAVMGAEMRQTFAVRKMNYDGLDHGRGRSRYLSVALTPFRKGVRFISDAHSFLLVLS